MRSTVFRVAAATFTLWASAALAPSPSEASRFAIGYQRESWGEVDLDKNPNPARTKLGDQAHTFKLDGMNNWYLEEPGFIFSLIAGMAQSEANEVEARNEAIRKGEGTYRWAYATPPPIPTGRWFRWGYTSGRFIGEGKDSNTVFLYRRYDANIVMAPRLIAGSDFYWMLGSRFSGTSLRMYSRGEQPGDDWSFADTPLDGYLGWQPRFFPYLMVEGFAGYDFIDFIGTAILGLENYSHGYSFGSKVSLGVDWLSIYGTFFHKQDPLWGYDEYNRRYKGNWLIFGSRLDLGNIFFRLAGGGKP